MMTDAPRIGPDRPGSVGRAVGEAGSGGRDASVGEPSMVVRHVELHVRLPDRPGALGAVASRIGALGADITDVHIASRGGRSTGPFAEDVFHLDLPATDLDLVGLLHDEIHEVDGARVSMVAVRTDGCCTRPTD